ncbi:MAG: DUF3817 domain-containing protein [Pseudomonadales bacterium]|nr:DUF3817 domain-containing protein [Pseudomonadales bacterium]
MSNRYLDLGHSVGRLRVVGLLEGITLVLLVGVAVPMKYIYLLPTGVSLLGPIHGLVFILYVVLLLENSAAGVFTRRESLRALLSCAVPFGTFFNDASICKKIDEYSIETGS